MNKATHYNTGKKNIQSTDASIITEHNKNEWFVLLTGTNMRNCMQCNVDNTDDMVFYEITGLCSELVSLVESGIGRKAVQYDCLCETCFNTVLGNSQMKQDVKVELQDPSCEYESKELDPSSSKLQMDNELTESNLADFKRCAWCVRSLNSCITRGLPGLQRQYLQNLIFPIEITPAHRVCAGCWAKLRNQTKNLEPTSIENCATEMCMKTEEHIVFDKCVWCLKAISTRKHKLMEDGPEKDFIAERIFPREISFGHKICMACWLMARRILNPKQNTSQKYVEEKVEILLHKRVRKPTKYCIKSHDDTDDEESDKESSSDSSDDDEIPKQTRDKKMDSDVKDYDDEPWQCPSFAMETNKNNQTLTAETGNVELIKEFIALPNYTKSSSSAKKCFVPGCDIKERRAVPKYLRNVLLESYKYYTLYYARICTTHVKEYYRDWSFLNGSMCNNEFSSVAIESMLDAFRDEALAKVEE